MNRRSVLIVGSGVIGAFAARALALAGHAVTVLDPSDMGAQASVGSLAWLNFSSTTDRNYALLRKAALTRWAELIETEPDCPADLRGTLIWGGDRAACACHCDHLRALGACASLWGSDRIAAELPEFATPPACAIHVAGEGVADPLRIADWAMKGAIGAGAVRRVGTASAILPAAPGVQLSDGTELRADHLIVAAGIGGVALLETVGFALPLYASPGIVLRTKPTRRVAPFAMVTPALDFWQDAEGALVVSSALHKSSARADELAAASALEEIARMFPALPAAEITRTIQRDRPIPADGFPLIGPVPGRPGVHVVATHSGMTLAPFFADILCDFVDARDPRYDVHPYRPDRPAGNPSERGPF